MWRRGHWMQDQTNNYNKWMFMGSDYYSVCDTAIHYSSQCPHLVPVLRRIGCAMHGMETQVVTTECTVMISDTLILFFPSKVVWK